MRDSGGHTINGVAMIFQPFVYPELSILSYVVGDAATKECAVIDPPRIVAPIEEYVRRSHLQVKAILETHVHADFISGAQELKHALSNAPLIYCSEAGGLEWRPVYADRGVKDGDVISLGEIRLVAKHTPGHTPEHITWLCYLTHEDKSPFCAFTGDFLLVEGVGRPDLLDAGMTDLLLKQLHVSLFERLSDLPDNLKIFPSHGAGSLCGKTIGARPSSTLGEERRLNSAFEPMGFSAWTARILTDMPAAPRTFLRNKQINLRGVPLLKDLPKANVKSIPIDVERFQREGWVIDFRDPQSFGLRHLKGAINVPIGHALGNWLASVLPEQGPLLCILPNWREQQRINDLFRMLGCDLALTFAIWEEIKATSAPCGSIEAVSVDTVHALQEKEGDRLWIVDVRTPAEWRAGHIPTAHHLELSRLEHSVEAIPRDHRIMTVCGSGWRSSIAASILEREGYAPVSHIAGGMKAWQSASLAMLHNGFS